MIPLKGTKREAIAGQQVGVLCSVLLRMCHLFVYMCVYVCVRVRMLELPELLRRELWVCSLVKCTRSYILKGYTHTPIPVREPERCAALIHTLSGGGRNGGLGAACHITAFSKNEGIKEREDGNTRVTTAEG